MQGVYVKKATPKAAKGRRAKQPVQNAQVEPVKRGATIAQTAKRIGLSVQRTTVLIDQGILPRAGRAGRDIDADTLLYCEHLRAQAAGRGDNAGSTALSAARSRLTSARAAAAELENEIASGKYVLAEDCIAMLRSDFATMKGTLLSMAGKLGDIGANLPREELHRLIDGEVREALTALANPKTYVGTKR
jgi:hypothetical protein